MFSTGEVLRCSSCGAILVANSIVNVKCMYCGSTHFIKEKLDVKFMPDSIIKFSFSLKTAYDSLKNFILSSDSISKKIKRSFEIISISPVYVPCTIYDYGVDIYRKVHYSVSYGEHTSFYDIEEQKKELYSIIQDGSLNINDDYIYSLEPFDMSRLEDFNPVYLSGAYARYNDDDKTKEKSISKIKNSVIKSNEIEKGLMECNIYSLDNVKAYLPIWMALVKAEDGIYVFIMNDTTEKWVTNAKDMVHRKNLWLAIIIIFAICILPMLLSYKMFFDFGTIWGTIVILMSLPGLVAMIISIGVALKKHFNSSSINSSVNSKIWPIKSQVKMHKDINQKEVVNEKIVKFYLDGKLI